MAVLDINWRPDQRQLRQFSLLWIAFFGLIAAYAWWYKESPAAAVSFLFVSFAGIVGWFRPEFLRPIYVVWMALAMPIGWVVSHLLLLAVYYLLITPIAFLMRLVGYDPLKRQFERSAATYWTPHESSGDSSRYFRQF
jgi:carbamoyltransferase